MKSIFTILLMGISVAAISQGCSTVCLLAEVGDNTNGQDVQQVTGTLVYEVDGTRYSVEIEDNNDGGLEEVWCWDMPVNIEVISFRSTPEGYYTTTDIIENRPDVEVHYKESHYYRVDTVIQEVIVEKPCPYNCSNPEGQIIDVLGRILYTSPGYEQLPSGNYWVRGYCKISDN